jgi:ornithine cyclodeaminase
MRVVGAAEIDRALTYPALIVALDRAFRSDAHVPARHHHAIRRKASGEAGEAAGGTLLLMPAWTGESAPAGERFLGCKMVTVFPANAKAGLPSLYGTYLLASGETGEPLAALDARALTAWRTAAASALAARYLAGEGAAHLVMVGAGALAPHLVRAHAAVRPITRVTLWNRTRSRAVSLAFGLSVGGIEATVTDDLEAAVREADIVSCATLAREPLVRGAWLKKGAHLDLVGAFTPQMREADDRAVKRARVYVDTRGALKDAGDIVQPLKRRVIDASHVRGDLFGLCGGTVKGRTSAAQITLFKSVGYALEDLAAAVLVWTSVAKIESNSGQ